MKKMDAKEAARALICGQLTGIGYGRKYEQYTERLEENGIEREAADAILLREMDRVFKLLGQGSAYFA